MLDWLAAQPLLTPAVGLIAGIALDAVWHWPVYVILGAFVTGGLMLWLSRGREGWCHLAVLIAAIAVGGLLHDTNYRRWPADHLVRWSGNKPGLVRLTGTVLTAPRIQKPSMGCIEWFSESPRTRFTLAAETIRGVHGDLPANGLVGVIVHEPALAISPGDKVELFGLLFRSMGPRNRGELDYATINRRRGVLVQMSCQRAADVSMVTRGQGARRWLSVIRWRARAAMLDYTYHADEPGAQLLAAMVIGQRSAVSREINDAFVATGTVHYLSVSGAHVAMLASVMWLIGLLAGFSRRTCAVYTMIVVTAYATLAEPNAPVWRSAIMGILFCASILLRRPVRSLNWMAMAAIILLAIQPTQLFDPGFQLSFLTVVALLYLYPQVRQSARAIWNWLLRRNDPLLMPAVQDMLNPPGRAKRLARRVGWVISEALLVSLAAWLGSVPLAAHHFHRLPLWGWADSVVAVPLIWLTQIVGFAKPVVTVLLPPLGSWLGPLLAGLTDFLIAVIVWLAQVPGSGLTTPAVPGWLVVATMAVLLLWMVSRRLQITGHAVALAALVLMVVAAWRLAPPGHSDTLRLRVLDVGHGAAQIVTLPNGRTLLCDCGSTPPYDLRQWTIGPVLAHDRIARIDAAVVSHPHLDHFAAVPDVAKHHNLGRLMIPHQFIGKSSSSGSAARLLTYLRQVSVPVVEVGRGDRLAGTGEVAIEVLWPPPRAHFQNVNDTSVALRLTYAGRRILLCGDIGPEPQTQLIADGNLKADVLVLPHHGSVDLMTETFLQAVDPAICIRSGSRRNTGPSGEIEDLMAGRRFYDTHRYGALTVYITEKGINAYRGANEQLAGFIPSSD